MSLTDAERYHALKSWLLAQGIVKHIELPVSDSEPFVIGERFYGPTFEDAVDSLPARGIALEDVKAIRELQNRVDLPYPIPHVEWNVRIVD